MSTIQPNKNSLKAKGYKFLSSPSGRWVQKALVLVVFSLVVNHLATQDSFSYGESYRFPKEGFLATIVLSILIGIIADLNFKFYKRKYFSKKVETVTMIWFMTTTLGYITIMYVPVNIILNIVAGGGEVIFYYLLIGLLITLLLSFIFISLWYAHDLYNLYKLSLKDAEITIESGSKLRKLSYEKIACFHSENKIVYAVQNDGTTIHTDFTLNELEEKINDQLFFRANRQIIIHRDVVDQIEKIENGKLRITLNPSVKNEIIQEITISRYKRKEFMEWFQ